MTTEELQLEQTHSAISALNNAFKSDPKAIWTLFNAYTTCNEELANHPTVQVLAQEVEGKERFTVGTLGIINGVIEAALGHRICIMTSEPNDNGQRELLGFDIYKPEPVEAPVSAEVMKQTISALEENPL